MSGDDNDSLFRQALGGEVNKLEQNRVTPHRRSLDATPKQRLLDNERVLDELLDESDETTSFESGDELQYVKNGYSPRLLKKLRRGDYAIQDELDLHGLNSDEAKIETHGFINECARDNVRAIRIVHGKGRNSAGRKPILKNLLLGWLRKNQYVIAVCSTPANDGGTGAVYVLLDRAGN